MARSGMNTATKFYFRSGCSVYIWCNIYNVIVNFILGKPVYKWDTCTAKTEERKEFKDVNG
jgi:hypothetical protein